MSRIDWVTVAVLACLVLVYWSRIARALRLLGKLLSLRRERNRLQAEIDRLRSALSDGPKIHAVDPDYWKRSSRTEHFMDAKVYGNVVSAVLSDSDPEEQGRVTAGADPGIGVGNPVYWDGQPRHVTDRLIGLDQAGHPKNDVAFGVALANSQTADFDQALHDVDGVLDDASGHDFTVAKQAAKISRLEARMRVAASHAKSLAESRAGGSSQTQWFEKIEKELARVLEEVS